MEIPIRSLFSISLLILFVVTACEDSVAPVNISYQANIQEAIFNLSCLVGCHDGTRQAGLELTTWKTLMDGGDNGTVVISGNAEESPLVWSVEGEDALGNPVSQMPPVTLPQLNRTEIRIIKNWIDQGANDN